MPFLGPATVFTISKSSAASEARQQSLEQRRDGLPMHGFEDIRSRSKRSEAFYGFFKSAESGGLRLWPLWLRLLHVDEGEAQLVQPDGPSADIFDAHLHVPHGLQHCGRFIQIASVEKSAEARFVAGGHDAGRLGVEGGAPSQDRLLLLKGLQHLVYHVRLAALTSIRHKSADAVHKVSEKDLFRHARHPGLFPPKPLGGQRVVRELDVFAHHCFWRLQQSFLHEIY
eukprot:scaffold11_cov257-Pinguiococcus_pyrenoidosus.AAC.18